MSDSTPGLAHDAAAALALFAVDPVRTGLCLRARPGPVPEACLAVLRTLLPDRPVRRLPASIGDDRLLSRIDVAASLKAGRPILGRGLIAEADGALLVLQSAERLAPDLAARIAAVLDAGETSLQRDGIATTWPARFGFVMFEDGREEGERPPEMLLDRLAFQLDLSSLSHRDCIAALATPDRLAEARLRFDRVVVTDKAVEVLCATALALGIRSMRAPLLAIAAARAAAALDRRDEACEGDLSLAARLVLAPRATRLPPADPEPEESAATRETGEAGQSQGERSKDLGEVVLEAATAAVPPRLLAQLGHGPAGDRGGRGASFRKAGSRGRPISARRGSPRYGSRLDVVETLRAAAPWQAIRRRESAAQHRPARLVELRADDFRIARFKERVATTTIFLVDASGSAAFQRLAEAKGAVELLLAECYVRRDEVAVIAFRGRGADLLLPPTRSLVRAKKCLTDLPGGGGTPLAAGIAAGAALAEAVERRGGAPVLVLLSDGRANVAQDGVASRARGEEEALRASRRLGRWGATTFFIDTGPRPGPIAHRLADAMGARYLPLPRADVRALAAAVQAAR